MKSKQYCNKDRGFIKDCVEVARGFCREVLKDKDGVDAVFLTGSVARGDCEEGKYGYSIDICVVHGDIEIITLLEKLDPSREGRFLTLTYHNFPFTVEPLPTSWVIPYTSDLGSKYFALQESMLLYDREGIGKQLLEMKMPKDERKMRIMSNFYQAVYHSNNYRLEKWVRRNEFVQCHLNLSNGLKLVIELVYLVNGSFIPRDDYLFYFVDALSWLPEGFEGLVEEAAKMTDMSLADALRRRKQMAALIMKLKQKIEDDRLCSLATEKPYEKVALNFNDKELLKSFLNH